MAQSSKKTKNRRSSTTNRQSTAARSGRSKSGSSRTPARRSSRASNGRSASQKPEKYRFAQNVEGELTAAEREYRNYATSDDGMGEEPDVLLTVPVVKVDRIHLELDNLDANVALKAQVLDLVGLAVGVDAHLGKLRIDIEGVEAQALAKVRLERVAAIVDRVLTAIDRNPELVESLGAAVEHVGSGVGETLDESGEGVEHVGEGAGQAVGELGEGAGQAVAGVGEGAGQAVEGLGQGAGEAVEQIGGGAGQAVEGVGQGAGQAVEGIGEGAGQAAEGLGQGAGEAVGNLGQTVGNLGESVGQVGEGAGQAVGGLGQGVGGLAQGAGDAAGGLTQGAGEAAGGLLQGGGNGAGGGDASGNGGASDAAGVSAPHLAKEAVKAAAKQLGSVASEEAKDLSLAATRKVMEMGERRREKRADKHNATAAAIREAADAGLDVEQIEGSGADGRVTLRDVQKALKS